ncbi:enoyl-CoA hydratase/isomerase family protein [Alkanindiges sp. WGS2144]|uniref:enoyl-CoA hydratase/isomerase family protein n=1 Tax=Alkanindiges sp. WGS2144 TaxID=3366808 RepID=UPI0037525ECB
MQHTQLPETSTLALQQDGMTLSIVLNRPECRNAMSETMLRELGSVFDAIHDDLSIRAVVLRGAGANFCAGGDIKDMAALRTKTAQDGNLNAYVQFNRAFGTLIEKVNHASQVVVAVLEGAVLGGGFGLACVSDVALCRDTAQFGLPETGLGILPAQIAPFVVQRIGLTQARRLALLGNRFDGVEATRLGIAHEVFDSDTALNDALERALQQIKRTAPHASRVTKALLHNSINVDNLSHTLDKAAQQFAEAVASNEGMEGTMAFIQKRLPNWAN